MDRGRAGGFITDNNLSMIKVKQKQREDHLARMQKIKERKPGTGTLDNTPPVIIKAMKNNPRKAAVKENHYFVTEQENK
jgi:hypothetical protein